MKFLSAVILVLAGTSSTARPARFEWRTVYYSVGANEALLWDAANAKDCILATGKPEVLSKLRSKSVQGRAQVFVELLPPVQPLAPPPQGSFYLDPKVKVRGISIDPQCSASPNIYWIIEARFLDSSRPGMSR